MTEIRRRVCKFKMATDIGDEICSGNPTNDIDWERDYSVIVLLRPHETASEYEITRPYLIKLLKQIKHHTKRIFSDIRRGGLCSGINFTYFGSCTTAQRHCLELRTRYNLRPLSWTRQPHASIPGRGDRACTVSVH